MKENLGSLKGYKVPLLLVLLVASCSIIRDSEKCRYQHVVEYTLKHNDTINWEETVFEGQRVLSSESKSGLLNYHYHDNQLDSITNFTLENSLVVRFQYDQKGRKISRTNYDSDLILNSIKFSYNGDSVVWHNVDSEGRLIWKLVQIKTIENQVFDHQYNSSDELVRRDQSFFHSDGHLARKLSTVYGASSEERKYEIQFFYDRNTCDSVTFVTQVNLCFDNDGAVTQEDSLRIVRVFK
jgi:YD repeat-containing protein